MVVRFGSLQLSVSAETINSYRSEANPHLSLMSRMLIEQRIIHQLIDLGV